MESIQIKNILDAIHCKVQLSENSNSAKLIIYDLLFNVVEWKNNQSIWKNIVFVFDPKYKNFCIALNDLFYELTTEEHHDKFTFFMNHNMMDFNYCLSADLIESGLQSLINEGPFNKKASCIQEIGDWIYTNFERETDDLRKKEIAEKATKAITSNMSNISSSNDMKHQQDRVIIEQYLDQLKSGLSR